MINAIRQKVLVKEEGKVEILSPELSSGTLVEVVVFLSSEEENEQDSTDYLLSTEANREHLLQSINHVEKRENLIVMTPEEWNEKYCI